MLCSMFLPYPYAVGGPSDAPLLVDQASAAFLLPSAAQGRTAAERANYTCAADDIQVQLVFYSTFEPVDLWHLLVARESWVALWKLWAFRSCTSPRPRPSSMWALPLMC